MRNSDQARVSMLNAVYGVATSEKYQHVWKDHLAYAEGIETLGETLAAIDAQNQVAQGNPGASTVREQCRLALCAIACEAIGAIRAYCAVVPDPELLAKADYGASTMTAGKVDDVVARCKALLTAATENARPLGRWRTTFGCDKRRDLLQAGLQAQALVRLLVKDRCRTRLSLV